MLRITALSSFLRQPVPRDRARSGRHRRLAFDSFEMRAMLAAIHITHVPDYASNDGTMTGQVTGIDPAAYKVAIYIQIEGSGWWTKPLFAEPAVAINADGTFLADVFTGGIDNRATIFAAALIPSGETPPQAAGAARIPADLNPVAIDSVERFGSTIQFAGHTWGVKESPVGVGPGGNYFSNSPGDVFVDSQGQLHLSVHFHDGQWWSTEVVLLDSLGYGTYSYQTTSDLAHLDPNVTFGAFTWDSYGDDPGPDKQREIDFEDSRWGNASDPTNAQEVVQPYTTSGNLHRYTLPAAGDPSLTRFFTWTPNSVEFVSLQGKQNTLGYPSSSVIDTFNYTTDPATGHAVPTAGREQFRFNAWINGGGAPSNGQPVDIVISRFNFVPAGLQTNYVISLYHDLLGREPDTAGLAFWANQLTSGMPREAVATSLTTSDEYYQHAIIAPAYQRYLLRAPDAAGLAYWNDQLKNRGLTDERLEAGFIASPEFYAAAGTKHPGLSADTAWVDELYQSLLGRGPDSAGETFWVGRLQSGESRLDVAFGFAAGPERERARITDDYMTFLGRQPDDGGLNFWFQQLASGITNEAVITGFVASDEYFARHSSGLRIVL